VYPRSVGIGPSSPGRSVRADQQSDREGHQFHHHECSQTSARLSRRVLQRGITPARGWLCGRQAEPQCGGEREQGREDQHPVARVGIERHGKPRRSGARQESRVRRNPQGAANAGIVSRRFSVSNCRSRSARRPPSPDEWQFRGAAPGRAPATDRHIRASSRSTPGWQAVGRPPGARDGTR